MLSVGAFYRSRDAAVLRQMLPGAAVGILAGYLLAAAVLMSLAVVSTWVGVRLVHRAVPPVFIASSMR